MSDTLSSNVIGSVAVVNLIDLPYFSIDQLSGNLGQIFLRLQNPGVVKAQSDGHITTVRVLVALGLL